MRFPSVTRLNFCKPSRVSCLEASILGGRRGERSHAISPARATITAEIAAILAQRDLATVGCGAGVATAIFPVPVSRLRRFRSVRNSAALWVAKLAVFFQGIFG